MARARVVVMPSQALARDLLATYPALAGRIRVIPNPVDLDRPTRPTGYDAAPLRRQLGCAPDALVVAFVALGNFAHKGLGHLIEALAAMPGAPVWLLVVGGRADEIAVYRRFAAQEGVGGRVHFTGLQHDVRPWLWAADALALPSASETFALVVYQAAASGLPVLATPVHGVEDMLEDGVTGFVLERSVAGVRTGLERAIAARAALPAGASAPGPSSPSAARPKASAHAGPPSWET